MSDNRQATTSDAFVRPPELQSVPFRFGGVTKTGIPAAQRQRTFKPMNFSEVNDLVNRPTTARPHFGSEHRKDSLSCATEPSTQQSSFDINALRLPLSDASWSQVATMEDSKDKAETTNSSLNIQTLPNEYKQPQHPGQAMTEQTADVRHYNAQEKESAQPEQTHSVLRPASREDSRVDHLESQSEVASGYKSQPSHFTAEASSLRSKYDGAIEDSDNTLALSNRQGTDLDMTVQKERGRSNSDIISTPSLLDKNCVDIWHDASHLSRLSKVPQTRDGSTCPDDFRGYSKSFANVIPPFHTSGASQKLTILPKHRGNTNLRSSTPLRVSPLGTRGNTLELSSQRITNTDPRHDQQGSRMEEAPELTLVRQMQDLRSQAQMLSTELQNSKIEVDSLHRQLSGTRRKHEIALQGNAQKDGELQRLQTLDRVRAEKVIKLRQSYINAQAILEGLRRDAIGLKDSLDCLTGCLSQAVSDAAAIRSEMTAIVTSLDSRLPQSIDTITIVRESQLEAEKHRLRANNYEAICNRNAGTMSEDRDRIEDLTKQTTTLVRMQEASQVTYSDTIRARDDSIATLSETLDTLRRESSINDEKSRVQTLTSISQIQDQLGNQARWWEQEYKTIAAEILRVTQEHSILQQEHRSKLDENDELRTEHRTMAAELQATTQKLCQSQSGIADLESENRKLELLQQQMQVSFNETLAECRKECFEHEREELLQMTCKTQHVQQDMENVKAQFSCVNDENIKLRGQIDDFKRTVHQNELEAQEHQLKLKQTLEDAMHCSEQTLTKAREQEHIQYENQVKSQSSRILRLEKELASCHEKELELRRGWDLTREALSEKQILEDDCKRLRQENAELLAQQAEDEAARTDHDAAKVQSLHLLEKEILDLRKAHTTIERKHKDATVTMQVLREENAILKSNTAATATTATTQAVYSRSKVTQGHTGTVSRPKAKDPEITHFASITSDSLEDEDVDEEEDNPRDLDFVHDTPPRSANTAPVGRVRKGKTQDKKRRSLPVDVVRNTQEDPPESFLQSHSSGNRVSHGGAGGQDKSGRGRGTNRQSYKKRKSN